jgi:hypothetical protein
MTDVGEFNFPRGELRKKVRLGRGVGLLRQDRVAPLWGDVSLEPTGKVRGPDVHHGIIILDIM